MCAWVNGLNIIYCQNENIISYIAMIRSFNPHYIAKFFQEMSPQLNLPSPLSQKKREEKKRRDIFAIQVCCEDTTQNMLLECEAVSTS